MFAGKPVNWGTILFTPKPSSERTEGAGKTAAAAVDEQGRYRLSTYGEYDGALTGSHAVQFQYEYENPEFVSKIRMLAKEAGRPVTRYLRPKSPSALVEAGDNEIDIELVGAN